MQRAPTAPGHQQPAVHERIRVIARKNHRPGRGYVFFANDVNAPKKRIRDDANQGEDQALHRLQPPKEKATRPGSPADGSGQPG
jgi:hypothetical protein